MMHPLPVMPLPPRRSPATPRLPDPHLVQRVRCRGQQLAPLQPLAMVSTDQVLLALAAFGERRWRPSKLVGLRVPQTLHRRQLQRPTAMASLRSRGHLAPTALLARDADRADTCSNRGNQFISLFPVT